ncbi:hypothetical protein BDR07DRAFT_1389269 [Suillus spraguei]|nr:hypothetical protein BDR07DRAFT_1389269 [Suillus spraguei]
MSSKFQRLHAQILVIGGGPSGSFAASALAREGLDVVLLEAAQFPRYHIGESLIPSVRHYLKFIDVEKKVVEMGFQNKPGAAIKFNQFKREGYTDFAGLGHFNSVWNVVRSEFDKLLLDHAASCGAKVFEQTSVKSLRFSTTESSRPVAAEWLRSADGETGEISFDYLVDASGRAGLMSTKHLRNRHVNASLKNIALWGYWTGAGSYGLNTTREGAPWFETLSDESGWAWFIPLHDGTTSVGVVMNQDMYNERVRALKGSSMEERYRLSAALAPGLVELLGPAKLVQKQVVGGQPGELEPLIRSASDYSYSASSYGGPGFRVVGDAGGDCSEVDAAAWHTKRFSLSYTRFQIVVMSAYQQIRSTKLDILNDIDEDNYDRAFAAFDQGASEMGSRLSAEELQNALEFCGKCFNPTSPNSLSAASKAILPKEVFDASAPLMNPQAIQSIVSKTFNHTSPKSDEELSGAEEELKLALDQINGRRVMHPEHNVNNMETEEVNGFVVRLQQGNLGLVRA